MDNKPQKSVENNHFMKKKSWKNFKFKSFKSKVHILDSFDSYFRVVLSRGIFVIVFERRVATQQAHKTSMISDQQQSFGFTPIRVARAKKLFILIS